MEMEKTSTSPTTHGCVLKATLWYSDRWNILMFNRKYIFIQGPFSIAILVYWSVNYPHLIPTYCTSRSTTIPTTPCYLVRENMSKGNHNPCSFQPKKKLTKKRYLACHHGTFAEKLIPRRPNLSWATEKKKKKHRKSWWFNRDPYIWSYIVVYEIIPT